MAKLKRPANFQDTKQLPRDEIMLEIGRIAIVSASIEDLLHSLHWKFSGLSNPIGAVITADARSGRLTEDVIRIGKAAKIDHAIIDDLKDIFSDYTQLAAERNKFVHWIWSWNTQTRQDRIDPPGYKPAHQGKYVTPQDAAAIADDLVWLEHRLQAHCMSDDELKDSLAKFGPAGAPDAPTPWIKRNGEP